MPLTAKTAIVTGAAGGIGAEIARTFAHAGANLVLADRNLEAAAALAATLPRASAVHVDITDPASARALAAATLETHGAIDILIACAGLDAPRGIAWDEPDDLWRLVIDTDLSGAWWTAKAVIPTMIAQHAGRIVFIGSVASRRANRTTTVAYNAAKAGLNGLAIGLAKQLEPHQILVNTIAPGPTGNTGEPMTPAEIEAENALYPLGLGGPTPIAQACLYLAGPAGAWVSGTILNVSGGRWHG